MENGEPTYLAGKSGIEIVREIIFETMRKEIQKSNVSLRSIQMYEQRNKDINKASVDTVYRLSKTLGCTMEDLIEK
ncbi:putative helix-turn-helix protein [Roseburia sp. CAG:309]|nr:putative helix-turn-helix protein [Roseburia sp. CAG:309]